MENMGSLGHMRHLSHGSHMVLTWFSHVIEMSLSITRSFDNNLDRSSDYRICLPSLFSKRSA
ncbi:MAG: hypothetical protein ACI9HK_006196 [Pirellulaceae bacterium]|jgi:hypothetical protein